jgi:hypothetical protein
MTSNINISFILKLFYVGDGMTRYSEFDGIEHFPNQIPSQVFVKYPLICYFHFKYNLRRYFELFVSLIRVMTPSYFVFTAYGISEFTEKSLLYRLPGL